MSTPDRRTGRVHAGSTAPAERGAAARDRARRGGGVRARGAHRDRAAGRGRGALPARGRRGSPVGGRARRRGHRPPGGPRRPGADDPAARHQRDGRDPAHEPRAGAVAARGARSRRSRPPPTYGYLELDEVTGRRGPRFGAAEEHLVALTGAEAALVVTNNAAALLLAVGLAGRRGSIVVSRGELVEIGGGVRIPEIVARAGARLVEVGTTNRTRPGDFEAALAEGGATRRAPRPPVQLRHERLHGVGGPRRGGGDRPPARRARPRRPGIRGAAGHGGVRARSTSPRPPSGWRPGRTSSCSAATSSWAGRRRG